MFGRDAVRRALMALMEDPSDARFAERPVQVEGEPGFFVRSETWEAAIIAAGLHR